MKAGFLLFNQIADFRTFVPEYIGLTDVIKEKRARIVKAEGHGSVMCQWEAEEHDLVCCCLKERLGESSNLFLGLLVFRISSKQCEKPSRTVSFFSNNLNLFCNFVNSDSRLTHSRAQCTGTKRFVNCRAHFFPLNPSSGK